MIAEMCRKAKIKWLIWFFVKGNPYSITSVNWTGELAVYFNDRKEPFNVSYFNIGSPIRLALENLQLELEKF